MTRFSIIVPVYNAEEFLEECLDSICKQTYSDFEAVCVNDGSTDDTARLLAERARQDGRIRVVDKPNAGPSSARNRGIDESLGDYIVFLDADDRLEPYALERIAREVDERPCDAVVFGWTYFPAGALADRFVREHVRVRDAWYPAFAPALVFEEMSNPYLRLAVRREALLSSKVRFDETLNVGEDALFLFSLYPRIGAVRLISDALYCYRLPHDGSIMAEYKYDVPHLCVSDLNSAIAIFGDWKKGGFLEKYASELVKWFVHGQLYTILRQPVELRDALVAVVRQMLRANFTTAQLVGLDVNEQTARLVRIVLAASEEGKLVVGERELSRALFSWRIAEYGVADLAVTAAEHTAAGLLKNKEMLLRGGRGQAGHASEAAPVAAKAAANAAVQETSAGQGPIVSVIVPVYNVESFLDQALGSIEAQTLENIEIICVNDGSTDGSARIASEHAARDSRIRVIDKPNGGYGSACNGGFAEARGTWIAIVEPDDWIEPGMYASMVAFADSFAQPVDIVKTPYWRIWMPDTDRQRRINCSYRGRIKPAAQPFKLTDPGVTHLIIHHPSIWSALYRRDFLERTGIKMREIPGAGWADNPFLAETLVQAEAIAYLDEPFYNYREETPEKTASVARSGWKVSLDRWHDMFDVYDRLGVTDENIRRAHVRRGFTYVGLILEYHDLDQEPDVRDEVLRVFSRMDDALVFSEPNISPGSKELFAKMTGRELPKVSPVPYLVQVVKGGAYNVVNTGPAMTLDTLRSFVSAHARREGK